MVVARASGTLIASSLKQNAFLTLELHPVWAGTPLHLVTRIVWRRGSLPLQSVTHAPGGCRGGDPRTTIDGGPFCRVPHPTSSAQEQK